MTKQKKEQMLCLQAVASLTHLMLLWNLLHFIPNFLYHIEIKTKMFGFYDLFSC